MKLHEPQQTEDMHTPSWLAIEVEVVQPKDHGPWKLKFITCYLHSVGTVL